MVGGLYGKGLDKAAFSYDSVFSNGEHRRYIQRNILTTYICKLITCTITFQGQKRQYPSQFQLLTGSGPFLGVSSHFNHQTRQFV